MMGREALVRAHIGSDAGDVRALLESSELILRGAIRRRFPRCALERVAAQDGVLRFACAGELVELHMAVGVAQNWAKAIAKGPPTLRAKLGLDAGARAKLIGSADDLQLAEALNGVLVENTREANMLIARIDALDDLATACAAHAFRPELPMWTIYPKGKDVLFGENAIRTALREVGFRDNKSCAVSDRLTATRYALPTA
jgi:hypothetical protein